MAKKTIKLLPDKLIYTEKIENWLNEMANEGLILKRIGQYFAIFEMGEPKDIKYCIEAYDSYFFEDQVKDVLNNAGFKMIEEDVSPLLIGRTKKDIKYYVFKVELKEDTDKNTDKLCNATGINQKRIKEKKLYRTYKTRCKIFAALGLLSYIVFYSLYVSSIMLTISVLFLILSIIQRKEKERIEQIGDFEAFNFHSWREYYPKHILKITAAFLLKAIGIFYAVVLVVSPMLFLRAADLDDVNSFIRLEDIQQAYKKEIEPTYGASIPSPFTPTFYKAEEAGLSESEDGNVKMVEYKIVHSKSIVPFVTYIGYNSCIVRNLNSTAYQFQREIKYMSSERFNKIAYLDFKWTRERTVEMCLCSNTELIYIYYRGDKTADEIVDAVEDTLRH